MALQKKLHPEELALLEILQDPIWLGEFLRNTSDFSENPETWRKGEPFAYRYYQKDLLTDKSPLLCLTAGRAVGKCQPVGARIYVHPYGYMTIMEILRLFKKKTFLTYGITNQGTLAQKRAFIKFNGRQPVYHVKTVSGFETLATGNHPFLTPDGFVPLQELAEGSLIGVASRIPSAQTNNTFTWAELRWLGYVVLQDYVRPQMRHYPRFSSHNVEFAEIARQFNAILQKNRDQSFMLVRKKGPSPHYVTRLMSMFPSSVWYADGADRLPLTLKAENPENIKVFLEALFSMFAEFSPETVYIDSVKKRLLQDIQELLLRFGIETTLREVQYPPEQEVPNGYRLELAGYRAYYNFFSQLTVPGVTVRNLKVPLYHEDPGWHRFEQIVSIELGTTQNVFAIQVQDIENYLAENIIVHNSVVLEDKLVYNAVNAAIEFPMTKEAVLVTANTSQMTPLLDHVTSRFLVSPLLKNFLNNQINRTKGTLDFNIPGGSVYRLYARIAGSRGESNMVMQFAIRM